MSQWGRAEHDTLEIERLEDRELLAGTVQVIYLENSGTLILIGDEAGNEVQVASDTDGNVVISALDQTTTFEGDTTIEGEVNTTVVLLGDGDDVIGMTDLNSETATATTLVIGTGNGNDEVLLTNVNIAGTSVIGTGAGEDLIQLGGNTFGGTAIVSLGDGDDQYVAPGVIAENDYNGLTVLLGGNGRDLLSDRGNNYAGNPLIFGFEGGPAPA